MSGKLIDSIEQFEKIKDQESKFLFLKHSITCPISQAAFEEYEKFLEDVEVNSYYLHVQEARSLSNYIAETYNIKHESPQALLFINGEVIWNDSHWNITYDTLQKIITSHT